MAKTWVVMRQVQRITEPFRVCQSEAVAKKVVKESIAAMKRLAGASGDGLVHYWYQEVEVEE